MTIDERLERFGAGPATADWGDVYSRGLRLRRRRRMTLAGVASAALLVVAATPAFGLGARVIDFFKGEPAPEAQKTLFAELNTGAPPGMAPGVDASQAREVMTRELYNGPYTLWVAPASSGNFCVHYARHGRGGGGGCVDRRIMPIYPEFAQASWGKPILAFGSVTAHTATHIELELGNGRSVKAELVWVSEPIDAGFFVTEAPSRPTAVVALDSSGDEVARLSIPKVEIPPGR